NNKSRDVWTESRYAVQVAKSAEFGQPVLDPLRSVLARKRPEWRRFAVTVDLLRHQIERPTFDRTAYQQRYLEKRLLNQRDYFAKNGEKSVKRVRGGAGTALILLGSLPLVLLVVIYNNICGWGMDTACWVSAAVVCMFPVAVPMVAAWIQSSSRILDHDRRAVRYPDMVAKLDRLAAEAPIGGSERLLQEWVARAEDLF